MHFGRFLAMTLSIALITTLSPVGSFAQESNSIQGVIPPKESREAMAMTPQPSVAETEIVSMQRDGVKAVRQMLAIYQKSGLKETGKMNMIFKLDSTDYKIAVDFKLNEYQSISNLLKGNASLDGKGSLIVSAVVNTRDYSSTPDAEYNYPKKTETTLFAIDFAGVVKFVDKKVYFTLNQLDLAPGAVLKDAVELADMIEKAQKQIVGKSFQLPASEFSVAETATYLAHLEKAMQILENNSLLEVVSKKGNTSTMRFKRSTLQAVNLALGNKKNAGLSDISSLTPKNGVISFSSNGNTVKLGITDGTVSKRWVANSMVLAKKDGAYRFDAQMQDGNRKNGSKMSMSMDASRMIMEVTDWSKYSYTDVSVLWEDSNLNIKSATTPRGSDSYTAASNFEINGSLDIWGGNANLTLFVDGTRYGNVTLSTRGNNYSLGITGDYSADGTNMSLTMLVEAMLESGEYIITAPEKFEKINSLNGLNF